MAGVDPSVGDRMHALAAGLYPICRSITGDGVRQTLAAIGREIPLEVHELASGTAVFDWTVPDEWNISDADIADASGTRIVDFRRSDLHVVNYSMPVRARMTRTELEPHLFSLPDHPDWVPYRTSYYERPQMGKRGLYTAMAEADDARAHQMAMLWVLNLSDGAHTLLDIADCAGVPSAQVRRAADVLLEHALLAPEPEAAL